MSPSTHATEKLYIKLHVHVLLHCITEEQPGPQQTEPGVDVPAILLLEPQQLVWFPNTWGFVSSDMFFPALITQISFVISFC